MKKLAIALMATLTLVSCQITERVFLSETGAVRYESDIDFSALMDFVYTAETIDSLRQIGEFPIDTLLAVADAERFQQSNPKELTKEDKELMKAMDKTQVRMVMSEDIGKTVIITEEKDIKSFNAYLKNLNEYVKAQAEKDTETSGMFDNAAYLNVLDLNYNRKTFTRKSLSPKTILEEGEEDSMDLGNMYEMFSYTLEYHFPKKIKSVSLENAVISADGKSFTAEVPFKEAAEDPNKFDFTVEFK